MHIRVAISLADIEIQFLDCCQMMGKLSTNIVMVPDSLGEFVWNLAFWDQLCMALNHPICCICQCKFLNNRISGRKCIRLLRTRFSGVVYQWRGVQMARHLLTAKFSTSARSAISPISKLNWNEEKCTQEPIWYESKIYGGDRGFLKVAREIVGSVVSGNNGAALPPSFFLGGNFFYVGQIDKAKERTNGEPDRPKRHFFAQERKWMTLHKLHLRTPSPPPSPTFCMPPCCSRRADLKKQ